MTVWTVKLGKGGASEASNKKKSTAILRVQHVMNASSEIDLIELVTRNQAGKESA